MSVLTPVVSKGLFEMSSTGVKAFIGTTTRTTSTTVTVTSVASPSASELFFHSRLSSSFTPSPTPSSSPFPSPSPSPTDDSNQDFSSSTPDSDPTTETPESIPAPSFAPPDTTSASSSIAPDTTGPVEALSFEAGTSTSISSDFFVSTIISASTDSTLGVHTFTQVTTIASFKALPSQNSTNPNRDARSTDGSSPPNVSVIIMGVMGGLVVCALSLLALYWCRRRGRRPPSYEFAAYSSVAMTPKSPTWERRFDSAWARRLRGTGSFGSSSWERTTAPSPYYGTRSANASTEKLGLSAVPWVHFAEVPGDDDDAEGQARPRNGEGPSQNERPPTYYTTSTGATIATTLPLYSTHDPSPISERSSDFPDTPTTAASNSPLVGRQKTRRPRRGNPLTPIGEKF